MFVLMDLEWVTNTRDEISPTQLAAVRVDENWNETDRFSALIRPKDCSFWEWEHVAYTAGAPDNFRYAETAYTVFGNFLSWLSPDDILVWWHGQADQFFKNLMSWLRKITISNKTVCCRKRVYAFLHGQDAAHGSAYELAGARGIDTKPVLEHCAINDVRVMRLLLQTLAFPQAYLLQPPVFHADETAPVREEPLFPYLYDASCNTIHLRECSALPADKTGLQGFETWKAPIKRGFRPCSCCKTEFYQAVRDKNSDSIQRSKYTFIYTKDSGIFHKYTCSCMLSTKVFYGSKSYRAAAEGRKPCRLCRPTPDFSRFQTLPKPMAKNTPVPAPPPNAVTKNASVPLTRPKPAKKITPEQPALPKEEAKAVARQQVASEERRRRLADDTLTPQQRADVFTLTQPSYAFWVSRGYQTFHLRGCSKLRGLSNLQGFGTCKEALHAGYTPCRHCHPTSKNDALLSIPIANHTRENEKIEDIEELCRSAGYPCRREDSLLALETPVGKWRMHTERIPVRLEHINLVATPGATGYHEQPRLFLSFRDAFDYIVRHDRHLEARGTADIETCLKCASFRGP